MPDFAAAQVKLVGQDQAEMFVDADNNSNVSQPVGDGLYYGLEECQLPHAEHKKMLTQVDGLNYTFAEVVKDEVLDTALLAARYSEEEEWDAVAEQEQPHFAHISENNDEDISLVEKGKKRAFAYNDQADEA